MQSRQKKALDTFRFYPEKDLTSGIEDPEKLFYFFLFFFLFFLFFINPAICGAFRLREKDWNMPSWDRRGLSDWLFPAITFLALLFNVAQLNPAEVDPKSGQMMKSGLSPDGWCMWMVGGLIDWLIDLIRLRSLLWKLTWTAVALCFSMTKAPLLSPFHSAVQFSQ